MAKFTPPTIEEVVEYAAHLGFAEINAKRFMEFYEAEDWHYGDGKKVRSWKRCVVTWKHNSNNTNRVFVDRSKYGRKIDA